MKQKFTLFWFVIFTVVLSFASYFIPLPGEMRSVLTPVLLVFIPAIVCIVIAFLAEGRGGLRQLFSRVKSGLRWLLIGFLVGIGMRVVVFIMGIVMGTSIKADLSVPGTWFVILLTIPFAYFEELGWRRFALDRTLKYHSPFLSALILGLPWGIIHLVIILPGMMNEGTPAIPQTIQLISLGIILTWAYIRSGGSVLTTTLLHGSQNAFVVINRGLSMSEVTWLSMWVFLGLAIIFILVDHRMFFKKPT
jgi:membrane protease YdiL (CAAX protease family)